MKRLFVLCAIVCFVLGFSAISFAGKPVPSGCSVYGDQGSCEGDATCAWSPKKGGTCTDAPVSSDPENTAALCSDGTDNDNDGATDCDDSDCASFCSSGACTDYSDTNSCTADSSCEWVGNRKNGSCQDAGSTPGGVIRIFTQARYGEYCYDPASWLNAGYNVGIWGYNLPIRAQGIDSRGHTVSTTFTWSAPGGMGGEMSAGGGSSVYNATPGTDSNLNYTVTADGTTANGTISRHDATCTQCHTTPPGHIADSANWGKCHDCHNLGNVIHPHAFNAGIAVDDCYKCHPMNCFADDLHGNNPINLWCTDCHGDLADSVAGTFKVSGMAGKPLCADCHDASHSESGLYTDDVGHGGLLCASCHGAPHRVLAVVMTCAECHPEQPNDNNMGPDCAQCHVSSTSPHDVRK